MIKTVRAKLHGIRVTGADLHYHGSITIDKDICRRAGILPLEFVYIWNKHTGQRISTYVLYGEAGSRCCILNGAAARTCSPGDEVIISAVDYLPSAQALCDNNAPHVLIFDAHNNIVEHLRYMVTQDADGELDCAIVPENNYILP